MLLKKLKLAGFKSFVDPTPIVFPGRLTAVVGPNGCGKSNVIDAVRWVMGESSAKYLRGGDMTDVIFKGSGERGPVSQASVEMIFDNQDGSAGGEWANYNEISIKRTVNRDSQSSYWLNGSKCRRKDVVDIFLGTGLGPRSYSIIEQGMISRLIEARPEELRVYLEEAAGISKYKERRRETEIRIKHTRENLQRVEDILQELDKLLSRLKRQANDAKRYKALREQQRAFKAQLQALRWQVFAEQAEQIQEKIRQGDLLLEKKLASQRECEKNIEHCRVSYQQADEQCHLRQKDYYALEAEITRLQQAISHQQQREQQLQTAVDRASVELASLDEELESGRSQMTECEQEIKQCEPQVADAEQRVAAAKTQLQQVDNQRHTWQQQWDEFNKIAAETSKTAHVQQARLQHLAQQQQRLQQQLDKLMKEQQDQDSALVVQQLTLLEQQQQQQQQQKQTIDDQLQQSQQRRQIQREKIQQAESARDQCKAALQQEQGRYASLQALQKMALGKQENTVMDWLQQYQLADKQRLAQRIEAATGWERAVETVLGDDLQAVCIDKMDGLEEALPALRKGRVAFIADTAQPSKQTSSMNVPTLADKVTTNSGSVKQWLQEIYAVDSFSEALALTSSLKPHQSVVTSDGLWMGPNWLRVLKDKENTSGVLQREQALKALQKTIDKKAQALIDIESQLAIEKQQLLNDEQAQQTLQQQLRDSLGELAKTTADIQGRQHRLAQMQQREQAVIEELTAVREQQGEAHQATEEARQLWQEAMQTMESQASQREQLLAERDTVSQEAQQARATLHQEQEQYHAFSLRLQTNRTQRQSLGQHIERLQQRRQDLQQRREEQAQQLLVERQPEKDLKSKLEEQLGQHTQASSDLQKARMEKEQHQKRLEEIEQQHSQWLQAVQEERQTNEQWRMQQQEVKVRCATLAEGLQEHNLRIEQVVENLPEEANEAAWEQQLQTLSQRIERLGAINLAAIDEYQAESERKTYLDSQKQDLLEALATLENAIAKIDKETRQRFQQTYDVVNNNFKTLFPRLFGGGKACLQLTGDNLLETGVTVMAQPPGKRNSSIQLLSGGEKAMTAVALVFAIFQLNPSPFCMLDEVDAPLDDANVGRFCDLVRDMSAQVQFVIITHNKVTMELAEHLSGVTMQEAGVSRIVSVDVEQAVSMAHSSASDE